MAKVVKGARFISKISEVPGVEPTIPPNDDHTLGWKDTDIYVGEWFWNITDGKIFYRDNNGISVVVTPDPNTGQIDPALLPGNYIGAMVYVGTWDASTGNYPGWPYPPTLSDKGNYWIVNVSGNTNLDGETDWQIGDYPIWNGTSWDKIDNSEPTIYANNVLYDNTTYTTLTNVDEALEKIFNEKFITPAFDKTVTINVSGYAANWTALQINGNNPEWINWGGSTLGLGSNGDIDSILKVGPKTSTGAAKTSILDLHWLYGPGDERSRWKIYSGSASSGVIEQEGIIAGYNDLGTIINTKISASGDTWFKVGNFGIGTEPSGIYKLEVLGNIGTSDNIYADTNFISTDDIARLSTSSAGEIHLRPTSFSSSTAQSTFTTSLATIGTPLSVSGTITTLSSINGGSASITGLMDAGSISTTGTLAAGSTTITGNITNVTGTAQFTGKASYANYATVSISSLNDIPHKNYVDDEILAHAVGWWASGTTQSPTEKDTVLYNPTIEYYAGINTVNPTYNLEVGTSAANGTAYIAGTLDVGGALNANADINLDGDLEFPHGAPGTIRRISAGSIASATADSLLISAGTAFTSGNGGLISLKAGDGYPGGYVNITGGASTGSVGGAVNISGGSGTSEGAINLNSNTVLTGNLDVNGTIDVSGSVNLGSAGTNEVVLRGTVTTIANYGDTNGMNFKFASASAFGNQVMGMEQTSSNTVRSLTIVGQDNTSVYNGGTLWVRGGHSNNGSGGDLRLLSGDASTATTPGVNDDGGNIYILAGSGWNGGNMLIEGGDGRTSAGGDITIRGGEALTTGSAGEIYIKKGIANGGVGYQGNIFIDHQINEVYQFDYTFANSYTTDTQNITIPSMYNYSHVYMHGNGGYSTNTIYLNLGIIETAAGGKGIFHTISGYIFMTGVGNTNDINIRKSTSGQIIVNISPSSGPVTGHFTVVLSWCGIFSTWTIVNILTSASTGTITTSKPWGDIV